MGFIRPNPPPPTAAFPLAGDGRVDSASEGGQRASTLVSGSREITTLAHSLSISTARPAKSVQAPLTCLPTTVSRGSSATPGATRTALGIGLVQIT